MDYVYKESIANHLGQLCAAKSFSLVEDEPEIYSIIRVDGSPEERTYVEHT